MDPLLDYLRTPLAIRERCHQVLTLVTTRENADWTYHPERWDHVTETVLTTIKRDYPTLTIPFHSRWRHFEVDGIPRLEGLTVRDPHARLRSFFDLAIVSVLLDAGAGPDWSYQEPGTGQHYRRSEGLAVASWHCFQAGLFSSDRNQPEQVDALGLQQLTLAQLAEGFQVQAHNPLVGLEGRWALLQQLSLVLEQHPLFQGGEGSPRPGALADHVTQAGTKQTVSALEVLATVLEGLGDIWPGRLQWQGHNLGDVWVYPPLQQGSDVTTSWIPFHKLSQWLTYSLLEPLQMLDIVITDLDQMTGLAEYRNGGLFLDGGLIKPRHPDSVATVHAVGSPLIVSWRALTVALLDKLAPRLQKELDLTADELPLVKILQGGTWTAGRTLAFERHPQGSPPLVIESDGTVF